MNSWIAVSPQSHFSLQNLPYGAFRHPAGGTHCGVAIGDFVLDLHTLADAGLLTEPAATFQGDLTLFASRGSQVWNDTRATVQRLLQADEPRLRDDATLRERTLLPIRNLELLVPVQVGDYTDFYSSKEHATNVGSMFRPDNPLMPNWLHLPVAYHGRSSSIIPSGTPIIRPCGQFRPGTEGPPIFGPSRSLDFELEVGAIIGPGNPLGQPISLDAAEDHVFGLVLVNDWSARDIQAWEYQPLGPFLGKNFATSVSPWVVPLAALAPWRCDGPSQSPEPLPYLRQAGPTAFDIRLEVLLNGSTISVSNFKHLYWSVRQQIAHHTINGCPLRPGDLLASGTVSGPTPDSLGCLLELSWRGTRPIKLADGSERKFLEDGDRVTLTACCDGDGFRVGFGEVTAEILPARGA